jgi:hypothetical protein
MKDSREPQKVLTKIEIKVWAEKKEERGKKRRAAAAGADREAARREPIERGRIAAGRARERLDVGCERGGIARGCAPGLAWARCAPNFFPENRPGAPSVHVSV